MTKNLFFIGKGGVGKSTVSSLTALSFSSEKKVLLVSLDPAHNLSDIFNLTFSDKVKNVSANLSIIEVNIKKKIKEYLQNIEDDLIKSNTSLSAFNLLNEFEIIKHSPGVEEYGLLSAYQEIVKEYSEYDFIIFDMPPTALTLKFFNLPTISVLWLNKLIDLRERIKEKKEIVSRIKIGNTEIEKDKILDKLYKKKNKYQIIEEVFKDKSRSKINLVVNPEKLSINEGLNIVKEFENYKISINNIVVNKSAIRQKQLPEFNDFTQINFPTTKSKLIGISSLEKFIKETEDL